MNSQGQPITLTNNGSLPLSPREQMLEVLVFLFLIVPSMILSFFAVKQGSLSFSLTAVATILRDLALVGLILFFLWRNSEPLRRIGWTAHRFWRDIGLGILLFVPLFFGAAYLELFLRNIGIPAPATPQPSSLTAQGVGEYILAFILVGVVAVTEETIFRGYLLLRFKGIGLPTLLAVLLSGFVFSLGHGYEGVAGVITIGAMGIVLALLYLWRQSLVTPMVMHFLQDLFAIIILPVLFKS